MLYINPLYCFSGWVPTVKPIHLTSRFPLHCLCVVALKCSDIVIITGQILSVRQHSNITASVHTSQLCRLFVMVTDVTCFYAVLLTTKVCSVIWFVNSPFVKWGTLGHSVTFPPHSPANQEASTSWHKHTHTDLHLLTTPGIGVST